MSYYTGNNSNDGHGQQNQNRRNSPPNRRGPSPGGYMDPPHDPYYNDNSDIYSQYSQPSFVSNNNTNALGGGGGNPAPRNLTPGYNMPTNNYNAAPPTSYNAPSAPAAGPPGVGDYFNAPQTQIQPRPSFSSSHHPYTQDFPDEFKSYTSTTNLTSKEWGVGETVPSLPMMGSNMSNMGYPPRASPYPVSPMAYQSPQTPGGTAHWHQARNQLLERRVVKQIPLINGNLVMDVPVPKGCITGHTGLGGQPDEMEKMRYSAATCDPDDFMRKKFSLRPYLYGRKTELFVSPTLSSTVYTEYTEQVHC